LTKLLISLGVGVALTLVFSVAARKLVFGQTANSQRVDSRGLT
jgi:hypothetical protein